MGRTLDKTLATLTLADCFKYLSESLDKKVKPLVDGWGKFSLRTLLIDWHRKNQELLSRVHTKKDAILTKGNTILQGVHSKKGEILSNVHEKSEELLAKKKHIIANVQEKGEEILAKKKHIIANAQEKGEELLAKKKQVLIDAHHNSEQFIGDVLDEAKQKIADIKSHHDDELLRRKRETEDLESLANLLLDEARIQDLANEIDTKMVDEVDAQDAPLYAAYAKPQVVHAKPAPAAEPIEYYTLPELAGQLFGWVRENLSIYRLLRRSAVVSAWMSESSAAPITYLFTYLNI